MAPYVRSRLYARLEGNQTSFSNLLREVIGDNPDYNEPVVFTRGQLVRLECCFNELLNTFLLHEEERLQKVMELI